mmetsp:Transcript_28996/g.81810  ORF Transcript_28996/g.81810 Transcript_28996/m.81810 type:complete len:249 (+) Transcript_28996:257-1003(+)
MQGGTEVQGVDVGEAAGRRGADRHVPPEGASIRRGTDKNKKGRCCVRTAVEPDRSKAWPGVRVEVTSGAREAQARPHRRVRDVPREAQHPGPPPALGGQRAVEHPRRPRDKGGRAAGRLDRPPSQEPGLLGGELHRRRLQPQRVRCGQPTGQDAPLHDRRLEDGLRLQRLAPAGPHAPEPGAVGLRGLLLRFVAPLRRALRRDRHPVLEPVRVALHDARARRRHRGDPRVRRERRPPRLDGGQLLAGL